MKLSHALALAIWPTMKKTEKNSWCMHFTSNNAICLFPIPSGSLALPQQQNEKRCYQFSIVVCRSPSSSADSLMRACKRYRSRCFIVVRSNKDDWQFVSF